MAKRKSGRDVHGIVLLDKRLGASSNQALQEVRRLFNANKAGHTGALDPLATGLLPLCFGEATKVSALMLDDDKRYQVTVQLGVMTDTGDSEGKIVAEMPVPALDGARIQACLQHFTGPIEQVPPMYSALKHQGKKLYELAREGKTVERQPRAITIYELQLLNFDAEVGQLTLDVFCSKGTYIRSLAEDIGHWLGNCGTVTALRRTKAGMFDLDQAHTLQQLQAMDFAQLQNTLIALDVPLEAIPNVSLSAEQAEKIKLGQRIAFSGGMAGQVRIYSPQAFLGLGEILLDGKLAPKKLFHLEDQAT
ncbi:tRNA pseudouridine(55) synthase TruB [Methylomonas sp. MO1]|uniref:tRNA pseudouridine(55) synthase TruB n=1 Tax=unclassified Methylomonas TaxID=2608980 RepID=UPI0004792BC8|nr:MULTISPECIES: tRNA pseudouridine(55) synthase TruB [unclassified Methylomonas]MDT4288243.1 tRNA pseudouridine(55) synthase TruB [Methylomonas sp. MO1]